MDVAAPMNEALMAVAEAPRDPAFEEGRKLLDEARRACKRLLIQSATSDQTYHLELASKALSALNY